MIPNCCDLSPLKTNTYLSVPQSIIYTAYPIKGQNGRVGGAAADPSCHWMGGNAHSGNVKGFNEIIVFNSKTNTQ